MLVSVRRLSQVLVSIEQSQVQQTETELALRSRIARRFALKCLSSAVRFVVSCPSVAGWIPIRKRRKRREKEEEERKKEKKEMKKKILAVHRTWMP